MTTDTLILSGDCKQTLKAIRSESVDLIVSSPPYGMHRKYGSSREKNRSVEDYLEDTSPVLTELCGVLKSTGSLCWQENRTIRKRESGRLGYVSVNSSQTVGL